MSAPNDIPCDPERAYEEGFRAGEAAERATHAGTRAAREEAQRRSGRWRSHATGFGQRPWRPNSAALETELSTGEVDWPELNAVHEDLSAISWKPRPKAYECENMANRGFIVPCPQHWSEESDWCAPCISKHGRPKADSEADECKHENSGRKDCKPICMDCGATF